MAANCYVERLIRKDHPSHVCLHHAANDLRIARVTADESMRSKVEQVTHSRYRGTFGWRFEGPFLRRFVIVADDEMIDFVKPKPGQLDRSIFDNQLVELGLELLKVPGALLSQAVHGQSQEALFGRVQMINSDARHRRQLSCRAASRRLSPSSTILSRPTSRGTLKPNPQIEFAISRM